MERYRIENNTFCIDVQFQDFKQLYDGRDPAPFHERDLDEDLVRYLVMSCEEIPKKNPVKLVMKGPKSAHSAKDFDNFKLAVHQFFSHEVRNLNNDLTNLFRQGRVSLVFGLFFLLFNLFVAIRCIGDRTIIHRAVHEGLIIMGWVALWKPTNIFLYEWWPLLTKKRIYRLLAEIPMEPNAIERNS